MKKATLLSALLAAILLFSACASVATAAEPLAGRASTLQKDRDGDRIDDRISRESGPFDVIVSFQGSTAGAADIEKEEAGHLKLTRFKSFDGLGIENVDRQTIERLSRKAGVEFIDILSHAGAKEVTAGLDVSTRAIKARSSSLYPGTAESLGLTGAGVTICIIDSGVDDSHESLQGKFVGGFNTLTDKAENPDDDNGHGTHVAAIALGSGGPSGTFRGVAPGARLVDVKALDSAGSGTWMDLIQGVDFCIANKDTLGIDIISMSMQSSLFSSGKDSASLEIDKAVDAGLAAVVCAGNYGNDANTISAPGAADKAITVGALDDMNTISRSDDVVASYSSRGLRASDGDSDVLDEYKPDVTAPGTDIISAQYNTQSGYVGMSGCSMATPAVAGLAALMIEQNPSLTPAQLKSQLRANAEDKGFTYNPSVDPKYDPDYGWGEAQFLAPAGSIIHMSDTTQTVGSVTFAGRQINAEYVTPSSQLIGDSIDSITLRLQRIGSPPGTFQVGI
ncbi:MAG: S8 family peptidase, partial [Nitrososphaera sp.]